MPFRDSHRYRSTYKSLSGVLGEVYACTFLSSTPLSWGCETILSSRWLPLGPLQECSGSFSLSGIKVQPTQMEEDVGLETLFVPIPKGLFDQTLDFIVEALGKD